MKGIRYHYDMNINEHTTQERLEHYAFVWLLSMLLFSAAAMFLGARPPVTLVLGSTGAVWSVLTLSWIICGAAAGYLCYRWFHHGKQVFGSSEPRDNAVFLFMILTGLNIGIAGLFGTNIFLVLAYGMVIYVLAGVACLGSVYYLFTRWNESGRRVFPVSGTLGVGE